MVKVQLDLILQENAYFLYENHGNLCVSNTLNLGELVLKTQTLSWEGSLKELTGKHSRRAGALNHTIHTPIQSAMLSRISQFSWEVKNWLLFKKKNSTEN